MGTTLHSSNHHKHAGYDSAQCNSVGALMRIAASIAGIVMTNHNAKPTTVTKAIPGE